MIRINQLKLKPDHTKKQLQQAIAQQLKVSEHQILEYDIVKRSIDARKKPDIYFQYTIDVSLENEIQFLKKNKNPQIVKSEKISYLFPDQGSIPLKEPPIVIGSGPAGLFCAYQLAQAGYHPILLERGDDVTKRKQVVDNFWEEGTLDLESNVSFGEGGAGTFSDGKLNTLVKDKNGRNHQVLKLFVQHGAPEEILYESKPHIGTDVLIHVVKNIRNSICAMGGNVHFRSKVSDFIIEGNQICGVITADGTIYKSHVVVLAIGHSARDTFVLLQEKNVIMEAKSFAIGFRVEHPQALINLNQYGNHNYQLPTAPYKLTAQTEEGRGVYSFCMCPGGYVVNASTEEHRLAINGMSYSKRDGENANSAIIIAVDQKDFDEQGNLSSLRFQERIEEKAFQLAKGKIPVQKFSDFYEQVMNQPYEYHNTKLQIEELQLLQHLKPQTKGAFEFSNLSELLPKHLNQAFIKAMLKFDHILPGFAHDDVLVLGIESRTSSPVRIIRDENKEANIRGLYPCGEGAGYAGGIMSAAMDGLIIAETIATKYQVF